MRHVTARLLAAPIAALAAAAVLVPAGSAQASVVDRSTFSDVEEFTFDDCGFTIDAVGTTRGRFLARSTDSGWDLIQLVSHGERRYTNPETGDWFTVRADSNFRESHVEVVSDTLIAFVARQAGAPFTVRDQNGTVVYRDTGLLVLRATFDVSSGEPMYLGEEVVSEHGSHPGYFVDFCDLATDLIG